MVCARAVRKLRIEYEGAIYHVMNRGDRREPIFRDEADRKRFLDTLGEACAKTDWQVHAFCLMANDFHLVVETPKGNRVAGMKWFLGTYTARFNRRHKVVGHLFSGRYKALVVDAASPGYFRTICDVVHLDPVRARLLAPEQPLTGLWVYLTLRETAYEDVTQGESSFDPCCAVGRFGRGGFGGDHDLRQLGL